MNADEVVEALAAGIRDRLDIKKHVRIQKYTPGQDITVWVQAFE